MLQPKVSSISVLSFIGYNKVYQENMRIKNMHLYRRSKLVLYYHKKMCARQNQISASSRFLYVCLLENFFYMFLVEKYIWALHRKCAQEVVEPMLFTKDLKQFILMRKHHRKNVMYSYIPRHFSGFNVSVDKQVRTYIIFKNRFLLTRELEARIELQFGSRRTVNILQTLASFNWSRIWKLSSAFPGSVKQRDIMRKQNTTFFWISVASPSCNYFTMKFC